MSSDEIFESQRRMRRILESPTLKAMQANEEKLRRLLDSPTLKTVEASFADDGDVSLEGPFIEVVESYQDELYEEVSEVAAAEPTGAPAADPADEFTLLVDVRTRQMLVSRMEVLVKAMEVVGIGAAGATGAIPSGLALFAMFIVTAELLVLLTKGPPTDGSD